MLPPGYYALTAQVTSDLVPDVLTPAGSDGAEPPPASPAVPGVGALATVLETPPRVALTATTADEVHARKRNRLTIRHTSGDRVVALVEVLSPGNKNSRHALRTFVAKKVGVLRRGVQLLLVDLLPPGRRDPQGIHGAIWAALTDEGYVQPSDRPLTLAAYTRAVGGPCTAYVQPVAVGEVLPDMPLFLDVEHYVSAPLERTYQETWEAVPQRWRMVLEGSGA